MTTRVVEEIDDWESEPFGGGYARLQELADDEFSGVVQAMAAKLCFLNGTVVGILDGSIEDFEDGSGTVYEAPSPALPLLALMQERGDEVRAKYYSEDTPISEVDSTLTDGGFSGFIELSENVLSGDYYVVYHAGRSMAVAYVGNTGQLLTDDEAFERADDEVGIYQVRPVDIEPVEIPEPEDAGTAGGAAGSESAEAADEAATDAEAADEANAADGGSATAASTADGATEATAGAGGSTTETAESTESAGTASTGDADAASAGDEAGARATTESEDASSQSSSGTTGDATAEARAETDAGSRAGSAEASTSDDGATSTDGSEGRAAETNREPSSSDRAGSADGSTGSASESASERSTSGRSTGEREAGVDRTESGSSRSDTGSDRSETGSSGGRSASSGRHGRTDRASDEPRRSESGRSDAGDRSRRSGGQSDRRSGGAPQSGGTSDGSRRREDEAGRREQSRGEPDHAQSGGMAGPGQLETRSVPSLDPARTTSDRSRGHGGPAGGSTGGANRSGDPAAGGEPARGREQRADDATGAGGGNGGAGQASGRQPSATADSGRGAGTGNRDAGTGPQGGRAADLEADLADAEAELERLEADLSAVEEERDDLRAERDRLADEAEDLRGRAEQLESERDSLQEERDELRAERDELQSEVERLRSQLQQLEDEYGAATDAERRMSPAEALEGTNLFVRYESKGEATLESAHDGNASREQVSENLSLEYHTQFEASNVSVAGKPFEEFLHGTIQYRFVSWVVFDLLYEIRDTGKVPALEDLYDAIPRIDRAELDGVVTAEYIEDGQERRTQESFDVVLRDRMGNALMVANLNDSRQAATESMMNTLVTAASRVGESNDSLAGACLVTSSFFEPEALETAAEATSGGLLSRDKRESFVKLSRKRGYHLCLAEAREGKFHLAVPEL